jgi:hypothetical protein
MNKHYAWMIIESYESIRSEDAEKSLERPREGRWN